MIAFQTWPQPLSARGLRGFLGLAGYYRKFIRDFGSIVGPLTKLLKETSQWSEEVTVAFITLKKALASAPVLHLLDFSVEFIVECDASGTGFGVVLDQGKGPLAFLSKQVAAQHKKLAAYERELIGLVHAI